MKAATVATSATIGPTILNIIEFGAIVAAMVGAVWCIVFIDRQVRGRDDE